MLALQSRQHTVDGGFEQANGFLYERGWTDGLPVVLPTPERVEAMLQAAGRPASDIIARLSPSYGAATVEKVAINAVMAGCLPEYMPVLLTIVDAIAEPTFKLLAIGTSPSSPLSVINGPIREKIGINCSYNTLGSGTQANVTIGRAVRLIVQNIAQGGAHKIKDQTTIGTPGKMGMCMGENEEASPWEPLHVERGFNRDDSTVHVFNCVCLVNILDQESKRPESLLTTIAGSITIQGANTFLGPTDPLLILGLEHARLLANGGLSKEQVKQALWELARIPIDAFGEDVRTFILKRSALTVQDHYIHVSPTPEDLNIVVSGGLGPQSLWAPTMGGASLARGGRMSAGRRIVV